MPSFLDRLLKRPTPAPAPRPTVPPGRRIYAIGDIHGRSDLLDRLIDQIDADQAARGPAETTIIFLGDLIDRGPDSRGVVERAMALKISGDDTRFLMGNHEEVFLNTLREPEVEGDDNDGVMRFFLRIGGEQTLNSYGIVGDVFRDASFERLVELARECVPMAHREFLAGFENQIEIGDYLFVHAGIRPGVAFADQDERDLRWIRGEFLNHAGAHGRMVVHGHTIYDTVWERDNRIGIDTGAYESGVLTALGLQGDQRWFLDTSED
jgi:serine/threonine protein phosphatase 1